MYCNGQYETVVSEFRPVVTHVPPPHLPVCISIYLRAGSPVQYPKDVCVFELYFIKYLTISLGTASKWLNLKSPDRCRKMKRKIYQLSQFQS